MKLALDIDGVLLDFTKHFYNWFKEPYVPPTEWNDPFIKKNWSKVENNPYFWENLPAICDPKVLDGIEVSCYITAAPCDADTRLQNLINLGFPDKEVYTVGLEESKVQVCKELGITHMVDDKPKNFKELNKAGITCYLMDRPWNQEVNALILRIKCLSELKDLTEFDNQSKQGLRFNSNKLRWRNIPRFLLRDLVKVGEFGEKKYDTWNFLNGLSVSDTLDSLERHLDAITDPNQPDNDKESKVSHLQHVAWNALVAAYMIENRPDLDDRLKKKN